MSCAELSKVSEALLKTRTAIEHAGATKRVAHAIGVLHGWRRSSDWAATLDTWWKRISAMLSGLYHRRWPLEYHAVVVRELGHDPADVAGFARSAPQQAA